MTTRFIGIREFRQNMTRFSKEAKKKKIRFIIMNHSVPVFELNPIDQDRLEEQLIVEKHGKDIEEALRQVEKGEVYTAEEVREHLRKKRR